ncbi:hypothetical protein [Pollutimonas bauzanensis]|uniref:Uncharacterized protein n=1 Tax=Pollutimonas bauzanensis TaxID=658167 RepID=A0A1M5XTV0_9BURK|nr:hypothetical protein [Pollutimonas bauzanensis]SHI03241.1 hypothetical protein SAMN04488135_107139 [Pollutimonas bauzanensis]
MTDSELETLRNECELSGRFWGLAFGALGAIVVREKGEDAIKKLWSLMLHQHQQGFYKQGLKKLGIREDEPPAVIAAKYHWYTNLIGGLSMEYVEETPKKVWIRYTAPMWTYPGTTLMAMPSSLRRTIFSIWHPANGRMMGNKRLGWVATKFVMEGHPYDEGYFIEHDHDLAPGEELKFEQADHTPEFDPEAAPKLDPEIWPEARKLKARRNWSREYVHTTVDCLTQMYGPYITRFLFEETMRGMAVQYTHEMKRITGVQGNDAAAITEFFARMLASQNQSFHTEQVSSTQYRIVLDSFFPFSGEVGEDMRQASFAFQKTAAWVLNGRVAVTRRAVPDTLAPQSEVWDIQDTGKWLY